MIRPAAAATLALVLLAACGGGSASSQGTTTEPTATSDTTTTGDTSATTAELGTTATVATTPPPTAGAKKVGDVTAIFPSGGSVDGIIAVEGSPLFVGSTVAADGGGQLDFRVGKKLPTCRARLGGSAKVQPKADVLLQFVSGDVWCGSAPGGGSATIAVAGAVIRFSDPVFSVKYGEDGSPELRVVQGFLNVAYQGQSAVVGPNQRVGLTSQGPAVGPFSVDELDQAGGEKSERGAADWALTNTPLAKLSYPKPSGSPTLQQAGGTLAIGVVVPDGVDPSTADLPSVAFTTEFADKLLGPRWGMQHVQVTAMDAATAAQSLANGDISLVVAPSASKTSVPFFEDGNDVWTIAGPPKDTALTKSLQGIVRTSLQATCDVNASGSAPYAAPNPTCYEGIYRDVFGAAFVPLDPFAGLLGVPPVR